LPTLDRPTTATSACDGGKQRGSTSESKYWAWRNVSLTAVVR